MHCKIQNTFENVPHATLTCDVWSEMMAFTSYLGVTAHYFRNGTFMSRCIVSFALDERHTEWMNVI